MHATGTTIGISHLCHTIQFKRNPANKYKLPNRRNMGSSLPDHRIRAYSDPSTGYSEAPDWYTNHNKVCRKFNPRGVRVCVCAHCSIAFVERTRFSKWKTMLLQWRGFYRRRLLNTWGIKRDVDIYWTGKLSVGWTHNIEWARMIFP